MLIPKVLLVDDEKEFIESTSDFLTNNHFQVKKCFTCEEALLLLRKEFFDIIVCDVFLPFFGSQEGGLEIARDVAEKYRSSFTIIISKYVTASLVSKFMDSVVHNKYRFIEKTDNFEQQLIKTIKAVLDKKYIFVCMPFDSTFDDIYEFGIKQAAEDLHFKCERANEIEYIEGILDRIYDSIKSAHVIIADMTAKNPNVFYEVGYAHALGKKVILLTQNAEDIPVDLRNFNHIVYKGKIHELKNALKKRIEGLFK